MPADSNVMTFGKNEVSGDIINFVAIPSEQECLSLKRTLLSRDFLNASKEAESSKLTVR